MTSEEKPNGHPAQPSLPTAARRIENSTSTGGSLWWVWALLILGVVGLLGVGAYFFAPQIKLAIGFHVTSATGAGGAGKGHGAIPVVASTARRGDMKIFLNGLGTVTPLNTVALHTRVDGQVDGVFYTEGQMVKAGDRLVELDPRPFQVQLTQAQGSLIRDQALWQNAKLDLDRYTKLLSENLSITQQQVDTQRALVAQYDGAVKTDQGMIDSANLNLTYCKITAPFSGRIGLRDVDPGNIVHATDTTPLAVIAQIQPITVVFTLAEDSITQLMHAAARDPKLPCEAWDRDLKNLLATGQLLAIDNQVDPTTGTVKVKASFENKNNELFPSEFVNARLQVDVLHQQIVVPAAAVQRGPDSTFAYVVKPDKTIELRNIKIGPTEADKTVVTSGLNPGDLVVTDGVDKLVPGAEVAVRDRKHGTTRPSDTQPAGGSLTEGETPTTQPAGSGHGQSDAAASSVPADASAGDGSETPHHHHHKSSTPDTQPAAGGAE